MDADDPERGIVRPSRFSTGGSKRATFGLRSSLLSKMKEEGLLGMCSLALDSASLESLSKRAGYRSLIDLVGLFSIRFVSVRAMPFSSTVRMTDVLCFGLPSEADPSEGRPTRLTGEAVRGIWFTLLLRLNASVPLKVIKTLFECAGPVVLLRCRFVLERVVLVSVEEIVLLRL